MTLDCVCTQSRVISVHSWYLPSFVILSFCCLPFVIFPQSLKHSFFFSSENTTLFLIASLSQKAKCCFFFLEPCAVIWSSLFYFSHLLTHLYNRVSHRRVFSPDSHASDRFSFGFLKVFFYLPIGLYLLCTYSIAYFFADCNIQIVTNSQLFFVKKVEIHPIHQKPLYKRDFLCYNGYVVLQMCSNRTEL